MHEPKQSGGGADGERLRELGRACSAPTGGEAQPIQERQGCARYPPLSGAGAGVERLGAFCGPTLRKQGKVVGAAPLGGGIERTATHIPIFIPPLFQRTSSHWGRLRNQAF